MHRDLRYCTTLKTALFQAIEVHDRCPILCLATPRATTEWRMSSCYPCLSIVSSASTAYSIAPDSVGQPCTGKSRLEPSSPEQDRKVPLRPARVRSRGPAEKPGFLSGKEPQGCWASHICLTDRYCTRLKHCVLSAHC